MTNDEYRDGLQMAVILTQAIRAIDFPGMLDAINRAESIAPILDPTAFLRKGMAMSEDKSIVAIFADAKRKLDALPLPSERAAAGGGV
jgi:hypothetical protein